MSNKNTKHYNVLAAKSQKQGNGPLTIAVPVEGYHNDRSAKTQNRTLAVLSGEGRSTKRNMVQRVYTNTGADGQKFSVTRHEPLVAGQPFRPFTRHKLKKDERGNVVGLGAPQPWVYPGDRDLGRFATAVLN